MTTHDGDNYPAIFDVDGVLVESYLGIDFARTYLSDQDFAPIAETMDQMKKGQKTHTEAACEVVSYWAQVLEGEERVEVEREAERFIQQEFDISSDTYDIMETVQRAEFTPVFVSGTPEEVLRPYADEIASNDALVFGTKAQVDDEGVYTGNLDSSIPEIAKREAVDKIERKGYELSLGIAFGDTEMEIPLFDRVNFAFLISPSDGLHQRAENSDWNYKQFQSIDEVGDQHITDAVDF